MAEDHIYPFKNLTGIATAGVSADRVGWDLSNMQEAMEIGARLGCERYVASDENKRQDKPIDVDACIASAVEELTKQRPSAVCSSGEIAMRVPYEGAFTYEGPGNPTLYPIPEDLKVCYWTDGSKSSKRCHSRGQATWVSDMDRTGVLRREEFVCVARERYDPEGDLPHIN